MEKKKNLEELATESPAQPWSARGRKKIAWSFLLPATTLQAMRQRAAVNGMSISDTVTQLMTIGADHIEFPKLPEGAFVRLSGSSTSLPTRYSIPLPLAERIQKWMELGYSNAYVCAKLVEKGFEVDHNSKRGSDLRPGPLEDSPEGGDVEAQSEGDDIPPIETGGTPTVR